jgi:hypothetical protein
MTTWWDRTFGRRAREPEPVEEPIPEEPVEQEPEGEPVPESPLERETEAQDTRAEAAASKGDRGEPSTAEAAGGTPAGGSGASMAAIGTVVAQAGAEAASWSGVPRDLKKASLESVSEPAFGEGAEAVSAITETLRRRIDRVAESLLENESLTEGLDDEAANALIEWGLACSKEIALRTAGLDDAEAEATMYPGLRATRRLMRSVERWVPNRAALDVSQNQASLGKIVREAEGVYGARFSAPDIDRQTAFLRQSQTATPEQVVKDLRALFEKPGG